MRFLVPDIEPPLIELSRAAADPLAAKSIAAAAALGCWIEATLMLLMLLQLAPVFPGRHLVPLDMVPE